MAKRVVSSNKFAIILLRSLLYVIIIFGVLLTFISVLAYLMGGKILLVLVFLFGALFVAASCYNVIVLDHHKKLAFKYFSIIILSITTIVGVVLVLLGFPSWHLILTSLSIVGIIYLLKSKMINSIYVN